MGGYIGGKTSQANLDSYTKNQSDDLFVSNIDINMTLEEGLSDTSLVAGTRSRYRDYADGNGAGEIIGEWVTTGAITPDLGNPAHNSLALVFKQSFDGEVSVKKFGAIGDGVADSTTAINDAFAHLMTLVVDDSQDYLGGTLIIEPGVYSVSSLDFTDKRTAQNIHVIAHGVTLVANTADKHVVDALATRWIQFHGLTVFSPSSVVAKSGIQLGPKGTEACGNNKLWGVQCLGHYSEAPISNKGSETTQHYSCRFLNDRQVGGEYAQIADGLTQFLPTSDYVTVTRSLGTAVSFTNNSYYGCQIRHQGGGDCAFLANTAGHYYDRSCYFLGFNASALVLYATSTYRNADLTVDGLFETSQTDTPVMGYTGLKYVITFGGDGTSTAISGLHIKTLTPHCALSFFNNTSGGAVRLSGVNLDIQGLDNAAAEFFNSSSNINIDGVIKTRAAGKLNLDDLTSFNGTLHLDTDVSGNPPTGAYTKYIADTDEQTTLGVSKISYDAWQAASVATGTLTVDSNYVTLNEGAPVSVDDLVSSISGIHNITFRNGGATNITFNNASGKLRNISGSNVVLGPNQSITYTFIVGTIWQQTAGKV